MADILVYNALKDVEASLDIDNGLGVDLSVVQNAIDATLASIDYTSVDQYDGITIEKLSCNQLIAHCCCNVYGSGYYGGVGNSPWDSLNGINTKTIYERLFEHNTMDVIDDIINQYSSTALKNNVKQYVELYAKKAIEKLRASDPKVGYYWLKSTEYNGFSNSMKVCSTTFNCGTGANCTWTVPADTTKAKFQLWGAGSGTNPACCCGGTQFGANGAYSELTINVTPGDSYTLCAGCSCGIKCCSSYVPGCACMSGVTGPGICCLKADGGHYLNCGAINGIRSEVGGVSACNRFGNHYCTSSGNCYVSYAEYCSVSCSTCGVIPVHADCCNSRCWCACGDPLKEQCKGGHKPIHGGGCLDTNTYGYHTRPPIIDSDTCKQFTSGCNCATFTSGACCGGCLASGWTRHPGHGGAHTHIMGGANTFHGDNGTGGMVKVSWE